MTTKTDYQKQAADLLESMGVKFSTRFLKHDTYFDDDKESRDIFRCTFARGVRESKSVDERQKFSIRFGQSLNNSAGDGGTPPTAYDVVTCLTKNDPGSFQDFCGDFGYDTDSRKAEKTYKLVKKEWAKVSAFFTPDEFEKLQEIQ